MTDRRFRGRAWMRCREAALTRAGRRCERCGAPGRLEVHHRTPIAEGGAVYDLANLEVVCRGCHFDAHTALTADRRDWRELVGR